MSDGAPVSIAAVKSSRCVVHESNVSIIPSASRQLPSPNAVEWLQFAEPCSSTATHAPMSFPVAAGTIRSVVDSLTLTPATHLIPNSCPVLTREATAVLV